MPPSATRNRPVTRSAAVALRSDALGEKAHARADAVTNTAKGRQTLGLRAGGRGRIGEPPRELHPGPRRHRAVRVADRDHHIPALADLIDAFGTLTGDIDPILFHHRDG